MAVKKIGLQPVQRDGIEYEFAVVGDLDLEHTLTITKSRVDVLPPNTVIEDPGEQVAATLRQWLSSGAAPSPAPDRPYPPAFFRERFTANVTRQKNDPVNDGFRGLVCHWLDLCYAGQPDATQKRHSLLKYLTNKASINDLSPAELRALKAWLRPEQDTNGLWRIDPIAVQEAQQVITTEAEAEQGDPLEQLVGK